ncbi:MAG: NAD(P)H-hydrate dehydratase [Planctomycetota bacterium]|jgi:NAD(P)H-hydrate epimerase|nr:NAD(P)H-hydrate dehydratase [Planctomycetota bacterium]
MSDQPADDREDLPPLPPRRQDSHKGDYGRILVIAGSLGMTGAGGLACRACLRAGAGVVLWAVPKSLNPLCESLTLEVMTLPVPETPSGAPAMAAREILVEAARETNCVILGPGLPVAGDTGELMRLLIPEIYPPLILDGGALAAVGADWQIIRKRQSPTVVTPHPGEMGRLVGKPAAEVQRNRRDLAVKYARLSGAVVVLKGSGTVIADGGQVRINRSGNSGLATAGSGDVLTGVIAALIGQGMAPFAAARLGVHLHGLAGDLGSERFGVRGLMASDLVETLPAAFRSHAEAGEDEPA